jgi:hypothetical protein
MNREGVGAKYTADSGGAAGDNGFLEADPETFRASFNRRPFTIRHHLADNALFTLPKLVALAKSLPEEHVKYSSGDVPIGLGLYNGPQTGLSIEETVEQIEQRNSWMVLKWIENDPEYGALLNHCLDEIQYFSEPLDPGMCKREGFIFISSPGAVTPFHMDPEYNFLLQIRGRKTVHLFDGSDRSILSEEALETFSSHEHFHLNFKSEYEAKASVFELPPGVGLHFPVTAPHWVKNGPEVSISLSITFRTPASERRSIVYNVNSRLRRIGINPLPFGRSQLRDSFKFQTYRVLRRAAWLIKGGRPSPSRRY